MLSCFESNAACSPLIVLAKSMFLFSKILTCTDASFSARPIRRAHGCIDSHLHRFGLCRDNSLHLGDSRLRQSSWWRGIVLIHNEWFELTNAAIRSHEYKRNQIRQAPTHIHIAQTYFANTSLRQFTYNNGCQNFFGNWVAVEY